VGRQQVGDAIDYSVTDFALRAIKRAGNNFIFVFNIRVDVQFALAYRAC